MDDLDLPGPSQNEGKGTKVPSSQVAGKRFWKSDSSLFGATYSRFIREEDPAREAELLYLLTHINENDPFWLSFLPIYLTVPRQEQSHLNLQMIASLKSGKEAGGKIDHQALAEAIAAHLEADMLPEPKLDAVVAGKTIAKAIQPMIKQAVAEAMESLPTAASKGINLDEAVKDAFLNRHLVIAVLAGILLAIATGWWTSYQADARYQAVFEQMQMKR